MLTLINLFFSFVKIGFTSFGGLSMVPLISSEMSSHGWMTASEISDIVAIAEMTPGPLGLNCATFAGTRTAGVAGALVANIGVVTPTLTLTCAAAIFFEKFRKSDIMKHIMTGVRPMCIGLVMGVALRLALTNFADAQGAPSIRLIIIGIIDAILMVRFKWSVPKIIILSAVLGLILLSI